MLSLHEYVIQCSSNTGSTILKIAGESTLKKQKVFTFQKINELSTFYSKLDYFLLWFSKRDPGT